MLIRPATIADAKPISEIYAYYVEGFSYSFEYHAPGEAEFAERIAETLEFFPYFVCEDESGLLGFAYAHRYHPRKAYQWVAETSVYVRRDTRQNGVGTALYLRLLEALRKQGIAKAVAVLGCPNEASETFHRRLGFTLLAVFPDMGYKLGGWHGVAYYALELNPITEDMREPVPYTEADCE